MYLRSCNSALKQRDDFLLDGLLLLLLLSNKKQKNLRIETRLLWHQFSVRPHTANAYSTRDIAL